MNDEIRLDAALKRLGGDIDVMPSEDFMDSVWMRAGRMEEASVRRRRLVLMGLMMFVQKLTFSRLIILKRFVKLI